MRLHLIFLLILCPMLAGAQVSENFYVIHLRGRILNQRNQAPLALGTKLSDKDKVQFLTSDAKAVVMSNKKGRYVLELNPQQRGSWQQWWATLIQVMIPMRKQEKVSSRAGNSEVISNLKSFFAQPVYTFPGSIIRYRVDINQYPLSDKTYFIWQYKYQATKRSRKVSYAGDTLVFNKKALYGDDITPEQAGEVKLYYFNNNTQAFQEISTFKPVFAESIDLKKEMQTIATVLKADATPEAEYIDYFYEHVVQTYGYTNREFFEGWLRHNGLAGIK